MSASNTTYRSARIPKAVCSCSRWAIFNGEDTCIKCGKLWPSAYGRQERELASNPGYKLLLTAIERHDAGRRPGRRPRAG